MDGFTSWIAKQFDAGVTLIGAVIALAMVACGIGALLALGSDQIVLAAVLGSAFFGFLVILFLVARATDAAGRLLPAERKSRWNRIPSFAKRSIAAFGIGEIIGMFADLANAPRYGAACSWLGVGIAMLMLARGFSREKPPLPQFNQEPLQFSASPSVYERAATRTVRSLYVIAATAFTLAAAHLIR